MSGKVYLVGAGPGDPGLVTVKGLETIKKADCIIYDRLCAPELLDYARPDCERIYVGKKDKHHTLLQEEINALMVEKTRCCANVVRLKGGDAYVFGRGGEEGSFLVERGIKFAVVPGVSSAIAGAAYAGIPVTHRGIADSFRVITAHNRNDRTTDMDFASMTDVNETLVFLMGLSKVGEIADGLIAAGRNSQTPAAVIAHATTPRQQVCVGTLADIAAQTAEQELKSPAMIVVGEVVRLREQLSFYEKLPLFGKKYLVPKIGEQPSRLAFFLREKGAAVTECMVGKIVAVPARYTNQELSQVDVLLFTSQNGVEYFMRNLFASGLDVRSLSHVKLVVIGQKTAQKLREYGLCADFIPEQFDSNSLAGELKQYLEQIQTDSPFRRRVIWYPAAKNAKDELVDELLEVGDCGRFNVYENAACEQTVNGIPVWIGEEEMASYDGIFFTCASSAQRLLEGRDPEFLQHVGEHTSIYSIGPKCSSELGRLGVTPVIEAGAHTYEGLLHLVVNTN